MKVNLPWVIPIDKLTYWRTESWVKYDNKIFNMTLRLHCDQLLLTNNDKILESLNMKGKMKGIFKGDVLILIICSGSHEIRKLKFQIKNNAEQHLKRLGEHFPVVSHKSTSGKSNLRYRRIEDVFKHVLEDSKDNFNGPSHLPPDFNDFVKLCLLDPAFPEIVKETQKIISTEILKND